MRITDAIKDKALFGAALGDLATWSSWLTFLKSITAEELTKKERKLFDKCCGGRRPPKKPVKRAACICGRRSGKSRIASLVSSWKGLFTDFSEYLSAGENAVIVSVSPDRQQSRLVFEYTRGCLDCNPMFLEM